MDWNNYFVTIIKIKGGTIVEKIHAEDELDAKIKVEEYNRGANEQLVQKYPINEYFADIFVEKEIKPCTCGSIPSIVCKTNSSGKAIDVVMCTSCGKQSKEYACDVYSVDKAINAWNEGKVNQLDVKKAGLWWKEEDFQKYNRSFKI